MGDEAIWVGIRARPLNAREQKEAQYAAWDLDPTSNVICQLDAQGVPFLDQKLSFDKVFSETTNTEEVYESAAKRVVESVLSGMNGTVFAYGQTSSGKTYTMQAVTRLALQDIFTQARTSTRKFHLKMSYIEIYNEVIRDLLDPREQKNNLKIHEDVKKGVFIGDLTEVPLSTMEHFSMTLETAESRRKTGCTAMNQKSSRSHAILTISSVSEQVSGDHTSILSSCLHLVDLAGSERFRDTQAKGQQLKEGSHINKSLLTLSNVIRKLSENPKTIVHVPFRDSKLTRILQSALGGNTRTSIICCITLGSSHAEETNSTLGFASRAKLISNKVSVNEEVDERTMIARLQKENQMLKRKLRGSEIPDSCVKRARDDEYEAEPEQSESFQDLIRQNERLMDLLSSSDTETNRVRDEASTFGARARELEDVMENRAQESQSRIQELEAKNEQLLSQIEFFEGMAENQYINREETDTEYQKLEEEFRVFKEQQALEKQETAERMADAEKARKAEQEGWLSRMGELEMQLAGMQTLSEDAKAKESEIFQGKLDQAFAIAQVDEQREELEKAFAEKEALVRFNETLKLDNEKLQQQLEIAENEKQPLENQIRDLNERLSAMSSAEQAYLDESAEVNESLIQLQNKASEVQTVVSGILVDMADDQPPDDQAEAEAESTEGLHAQVAELELAYQQIEGQLKAQEDEKAARIKDLEDQLRAKSEELTAVLVHEAHKANQIEESNQELLSEQAQLREQLEVHDDEKAHLQTQLNLQASTIESLQQELQAKEAKFAMGAENFEQLLKNSLAELAVKDETIQTLRERELESSVARKSDHAMQALFEMEGVQRLRIEELESQLNEAKSQLTHFAEVLNTQSQSSAEQLRDLEGQVLALSSSLSGTQEEHEALAHENAKLAEQVQADQECIKNLEADKAESANKITSQQFEIAEYQQKVSQMVEQCGSLEQAVQVSEEWKFNATASHSQAAQELQMMIASQEEQLRNLQQVSEEKDGVIEGLKAKFHQSITEQKATAEIQIALDSQQKQIRDLQQAVEEKAVSIETMHAELESRNAQELQMRLEVEELTRASKEKDSVIEALQVDLNQLTTQQNVVQETQGTLDAQREQLQSMMLLREEKDRVIEELQEKLNQSIAMLQHATLQQSQHEEVERELLHTIESQKSDLALLVEEVRDLTEKCTTLEQSGEMNQALADQNCQRMQEQFQQLQTSFENQSGVIQELKAELEQKRAQETEQATSLSSHQTRITNLVEEVGVMTERCKTLERAAQLGEEWKAKAMETQEQIEQVAHYEQELQDLRHSSEAQDRLVGELRAELKKTSTECKKLQAETETMKTSQHHESSRLTQVNRELEESEAQHRANKMTLELELEKMKADSLSSASEAKLREVEMSGLRKAMAKLEQQVIALNGQLDCSERKVAEYSSTLVNKEQEFSMNVSKMNVELEKFKSRSLKTSNKLTEEMRARKADKILCEKYRNETEVLKAEHKSVAELTARTAQERDMLKVHLEKLAAQQSTNVAKISELQEELDTKDKMIAELEKKVPNEKMVMRLVAADRKRRAMESGLNNTPLKEVQTRSATRRNLGGKENEV